MIFINHTQVNADFLINIKKEIELYDALRNKKILFNDLLISIRNDETKMNILLKILNINNVFFNELLDVSNKLKYSDKKVTYSPEYYLILILHVKNNMNNWKSLQKLLLCHSPYKSIYNQFLRWSHKDLLEKIFKKYLNKNIEKIKDIQIIDASSISNLYGSENVTINPEYTKKKVTKVSLLCDKQKIITSLCLFKTHTKEKKFKNKNIVTFEHDSKTIQNTIDNGIKNLKIEKIIGDGGYKTNNIIKNNKKKITIITPNRKNQKNNLNSKNEEKELKERYKIENVFGLLKMNNSRILVRKDRKIKNFLSWFYIACLEHNIKMFKRV